MTATKKFIPGKRIKTWHRKYGLGRSLRLYARELLRGNDPERACAMKWAGGKVAP